MGKVSLPGILSSAQAPWWRLRRGHDLEKIGYLTSDEALRLSQAPKSLIVLGGGAVAVEFAQFFRDSASR